MTLPETADQMIAAGLSLHQAQDQITKHLLEAALRKTGGNLTHAAKLLQVHRNTFALNVTAHKVNWKSFRWPTSRRAAAAG